MADALQASRAPEALGAADLRSAGLAERRRECDVLVVGSGIAGLTAALHCSRDRSVTLITKGEVAQTNTWYAQGGIAGAVGEADSIDLHVADTLVVGQGLCDEAVVRAVVSEAPEALESLLGFGVRFDLAEGGGVALAREGGHSLPRVLHSGDKTGAAIQNALVETVQSRGRIPVLEHRFLVDLMTDSAGRCTGALVLDTASGVLETHVAGAVVLATGGAGQVFPVTTNPLVATGDGVAAAWRAGARIADVEFVQFHPTALDHASAPRFLVSEAMRGEGAYLLDCDEKRFMVGVHPLAELAPRDVVSREIERVMARCGRRNVWLDARHLGEAYLRARFPGIWEACAQAGYDLSRDLVPVAPAAHYLVGGVQVDADGRTSVPGLYASGEVTASGLHGANRLASNSLLEGLVFSRRIARALDAPGQAFAEPVLVPLPAVAEGKDAGAGAGSATDVAIAAPGTHEVAQAAPAQASVLDRLHGVTGERLGMTRTSEGLATALRELERLTGELESRVPKDAAAVSHLELVNLVTVAHLIAQAASVRAESRGCHSRLDHPVRDDERWLGHIVLTRGDEPCFERIISPARPVPASSSAPTVSPTF